MVKENNNDIIKQRIDAMKSAYRLLSQMKDYEVFTLLCIKYFYYSDGTPFDPELVNEYITDGTNDGGIDAIFNDPTSDTNDVIIVQSKNYEKTKLTAENIAGEANKISETIKKLDSFKASGLNEKVKTAYSTAKSLKDESGIVLVVFFTSYAQASAREASKLRSTGAKCLESYEFELNFQRDISDQIESIDNEKRFIESGELKIDELGNCLKYHDSAIVNISAQSLQKLQNQFGKNLLGMNLRYYIHQKSVDDGIKDTVEKEPDTFWYKNNGVIIVCDAYEIDGTVLKLHNFSIVNGGQTTNMIGRLDIEKDFCLQCKVIKTDGNNQYEKDQFTHKIAEASNSQKPIKQSDLRSNTPEQILLKEKLKKENVYYILKKGDKAPKKFAEHYQVAKIDEIGKLGLAVVLQMPGSARNCRTKIYQDEYYNSIFSQSINAKVYADALKIVDYYSQFQKIAAKEEKYDDRTVKPAIRNGATYQLACIAYLAKVNCGLFTHHAIMQLQNNTDELREELKKMDGLEGLILNQIEDESDTFMSIFSIISQNVLGYCYKMEMRQRNDQSLVAANYLKSDSVYYRDILEQLWFVYNEKDFGLKKNLDKIFGSNN